MTSEDKLPLASGGTSIVFVTDRWGYSRGGINVFNTEVCSAVAEVLRGESAQVLCTVQDATDEERRHAAARGVELVVLDVSGAEGSMAEHRAHEMVALATTACGKQVDWWLGHDGVSGALARRAADLVARGRCGIFHHMNYAAYKGLSGDSTRTRDKIEEQRDVLASADVVFAVGPKLARSARDKTAANVGMQVVQIIPGLADVQGMSHPAVFSAITFGRLTPETDLIKQASLAVAAFASATNISHKPLGADAGLTVIGLSADSADEEHKALLELAGNRANRAVPVNAFPYFDNRERLLDELRRHSVCLMLSLHEGFGLTGWEAIAAEVPLIVSKNSGLFETIDSLLGGQGIGCVEPVEIRGRIGDQPFQEADHDVVVNALVRIAANPAGAKKNAATLKRLLSEVCTWQNAAIAVARACGFPVAPAALVGGKPGGADERPAGATTSTAKQQFARPPGVRNSGGASSPQQLHVSDRRLTCCAWLVDGSSIVAGGFSGKIYIVDVSGRTEHRTVALGSSFLRCVRQVPGTQTLLVGDDLGRIISVETDTGSAREVARAETSVFSLSFFPGRGLLYSAERGGSVVEWSFEAHDERARRLRVVHRHAGPAFEVRFDEYTQTCCSVGADGTLRGSRLDGAAPIVCELSPEASLFSFALARDRLVATDSRGVLLVGSLGTNKAVSVEGHIDAIRRVALSASGAWAATAGKDGTLRLWHIASSRGWIVAESRDYLYDASFSQSNASLITCDGSGDVTIVSFGSAIDDLSPGALDALR